MAGAGTGSGSRSLPRAATSPSPSPGQGRGRGAPGKPVLSRVGGLSVALCVATPRREARGACAVLPPCAASLGRDPGAPSRPAARPCPARGARAPSASSPAGFRLLGAGRPLGTCNCSEDWRSWSCSPSLLGGRASLCPSEGSLSAWTPAGL